MSFDADVIIAGGGPAGATAGALLAEAGHSVRLLEKEHFPRFSIGESLLPLCLPVLERLGFVPSSATTIAKRGAHFMHEASNRDGMFHFRLGLPSRYSCDAMQVDRAKFDAELLARTVEFGAVVEHGVSVEQITADDDAVEVATSQGLLRARYFIDATGRRALLARKHHTLTSLDGFGAGAMFAHYGPLSDQANDELIATGDIRILLLDQAWVWVIPLTDRRVSVGLVEAKRKLSFERFDEIVAASPLLQRITAGASRTAPEKIGNFSYLNTRAHGPRWVCAGDSACFLDPVFSSGVSLALIAGEQVADTLGPALADCCEGDPALMARVGEHLRQGYVALGSIIKAFYHSNLSDHFFLHPDPDPDVRAGLISMLAGDVWRDDNDFQRIVIGGRRRWEPPSQI